jgi:hypothetical protein
MDLPEDRDTKQTEVIHKAKRMAKMITKLKIE